MRERRCSPTRFLTSTFDGVHRKSVTVIGGNDRGCTVWVPELGLLVVRTAAYCVYQLRTVHYLSTHSEYSPLHQGCTTRDPWKDLLGTRHSLVSPGFLFISPDQRLYIVKNMCTYIHTHMPDCVQTV